MRYTDNKLTIFVTAGVCVWEFVCAGVRMCLCVVRFVRAGVCMNVYRHTTDLN